MTQRIISTDSSTTDAVHAAPLLAESTGRIQKTVHAAFIDLKKAFNGVSHEFIWWALQARSVPERYIGWIKMFYHKA